MGSEFLLLLIFLLLRVLLPFWEHKEFRSLRRATKGTAFGNRELLKKFDQNFLRHMAYDVLTARAIINNLCTLLRDVAADTVRLLKKAGENFYVTISRRIQRRSGDRQPPDLPQR